MDIWRWTAKREIEKWQEYRVRKGRRKRYSKGWERQGREAAWWTRASENEAECRWGKERGTDPLFSHTRPVPTADLANPCLNWGRIPAHMFPWNERRAKGRGKARELLTHQTDHGGWADAQCASALCWNINTPPDCQHVWCINGFTSFSVSFSPFIRSNMRSALSSHLALLCHIAPCEKYVT